MTGLSALGLALSAYLGWHYVMGGTVLGCNGGSSCDQVLGSKWSAIGGVVPVSGLAAGAYLAIFLASFNLGPDSEASVRQLAWRAILVLVAAAAGCAVWFTIVQKWFIGAFCPYCMATHITGLVLAGLVIWRTIHFSDHDPSTDGAGSRRGNLFLSIIGLALAGLLALSQVAFAPTDVFRRGESPEYALTALDPHTVPLIGSPDAPTVIALLFDYECPHCQKLHALLDEVVRRSGGKVAFALYPTPLNTTCNPYVPRVTEAFKDSCELTKIALAVWVARHDAFPEFDHWLFSPEPDQPWHPHSLDDAKSKAIALVGAEKFATASADPWISRYLQTCIHLYGATGADAVPKLVFGSHWVNPEPTDANDLISILQAGLAVPKQ